MQVRAIECGRESDGKTTLNDLTSGSVHSICTVSISEVARDVSRKIYEEEIVKF